MCFKSPWLFPKGPRCYLLSRYWTLGEQAPVQWTPVPNPLPSDCRFREDLVLLRQEDYKQGQAAKEMLENRQRADAKLRKAGSAE
jgi:hypothetical protein